MGGVIMNNLAVTEHYVERIGERANVKNVKKAERMAEMAWLRGKRSSDFKHGTNENHYLANKSREGCVAIANGGFCYIFSSDINIITIFSLPNWFEKKTTKKKDDKYLKNKLRSFSWLENCELCT